MSLLDGLRVLQIGQGLGAAVCGRAFADLGADVDCLDSDTATPLAAYLNGGKKPARSLRGSASEADLIVCEGSPAALRAAGLDDAALRALNPNAAIVHIGPFGQTGPRANWPASDLTLFCASGIARMLTGQVDDLSEPPARPVGQQSAFIGGLAAACAGLHAVLSGEAGASIDISTHEALATLAITELARAGQHGRVWPRRRVADGNGATVCILPATDGFVAISPREDHQWAAWLTVMESPEWGVEPRFAAKTDRVENWDALHALMSEWSRQHDKQWIADAAQAARVPSFPLRALTEQFDSPQLRHREFYRSVEIDGEAFRTPGSPFGITAAKGGVGSSAPVAGGALPLSGIRVLDFSWVIAGPTATRYLAAMGAEVIKVEAPGRGDPGRASELHSVLGQAKRAIVLDLKHGKAAEIARALAARSDIVIENFGAGVMERFGLGAAALQAENPSLTYISASGLGRTGPEARGVAYGTLLQCYAGFAGLNGHPDTAPRVGMAWLDPMCGLKLAFAAAAALWKRRGGGRGARIDFSMIEAMLWTMAKPILEAQQGAPPQPRGNTSDRHAPHGVYPAVGEDSWIGIAVASDAQWRALCEIVPALEPLRGLDFAARQAKVNEIDAALTSWIRNKSAKAAAARLIDAGVPAAPVANALDLVASDHLRARGFWNASGSGILPGLPWRASFGRNVGAAPAHGADTNAVLREVLDLPPEEIAALREGGALG